MATESRRVHVPDSGTVQKDLEKSWIPPQAPLRTLYRSYARSESLNVILKWIFLQICYPQCKQFSFFCRCRMVPAVQSFFDIFPLACIATCGTLSEKFLLIETSMAARADPISWFTTVFAIRLAGQQGDTMTAPIAALIHYRCCSHRQYLHRNLMKRKMILKLSLPVTFFCCDSFSPLYFVSFQFLTIW